MEKALEKERSRVLSLESDFECLTQVLNDVRRTRLQYKNLTLSQYHQIKDLEVGTRPMASSDQSFICLYTMYVRL